MERRCAPRGKDLETDKDVPLLPYVHIPVEWCPLLEKIKLAAERCENSQRAITRQIPHSSFKTVELQATTFSNGWKRQDKLVELTRLSICNNRPVL